MVLFATPLGLLGLLLAGALAVPVVYASLRRPDLGLLALAVVLPLQKYLVAALWKIGLPFVVVRGAGWIKEALLVGIVVAAAHAVHRSGRRLDLLDRLALAWVAALVLYLLLPALLSSPTAPTDLDARIQGFRANAFFVLLFLGARHAPLPAGFGRRLRRILVAVVVLVAAGGLYQFIDPFGWIRFTYDVVGVPTYQAEIQGLTPRQLIQDFGWLSEVPVRVGSVLISPFEFVDLVLIAFALVANRLVRGHLSLPMAAGGALLGGALVASRTRSTLLAAGVVLLLLMRASPARAASARAKVAIVALLTVVAVAPFQIGTRITGAEGGAESARAHVAELLEGARRLVAEPRGFGLGTSPGVGARFGLEETFVSDNAFLQVGNELGVAMMGLFVALLIALLGALHRTARQSPDGLAPGLWGAGVGLVLVGMLHHVWLSIPVAWLFFAAAGVALSRHEPAAGEDPVDLPSPSRLVVA